MITDPEQVKKAVEYITGRKSYIPVREEDFDDICPDPQWFIYVRARSVSELVAQLKQELEQLETGRWRGTVVFIQGAAGLTMDGLNSILESIPYAPRTRRGLDLRPSSPENEIWLFAEET